MSKGYHDSKTPESIRDLWRTPQAVFNYYNDRFNFTRDVAASEKNHLCEQYFDAEYNALEEGRVWGNRNWLNPPFSDVTPWILKAIEQSKCGKLTVMLSPADTSVKWFKLAFDNCTECHLISGRLSFINEETGKPVNGNNKGSVVFVFDPKSPIKKATLLIDRDEIMRGEHE